MSLWHRHAWIAYLAVFFGVIGHASSEFVSVLSGMGGPELSVWRFVLGGIGLLILALALPGSRDLLTPLRTHGLKLVLLSLFGVTGPYLFFHWSLDYASVVQVATVTTTIPIWVALTNQWLNKQPITGPKIVTGLAAVAGVALLVTDGYLDKLSGSGTSLVGVLMATACAGLGSAYAVLVRPIITEHGAMRITALSMSIGAIGLWFVVGAAWGVWVNPATILERAPGQTAALLTIGLWNTTITQFLWFGGLAAVPDITRGSYLFFLKPVIAAGLAVVILTQDLTWLQLLAILIITGAVALEAAWGRIFRRPAVVTDDA